MEKRVSKFGVLAGIVSGAIALHNSASSIENICAMPNHVQNYQPKENGPRQFDTIVVSETRPYSHNVGASSTYYNQSSEPTTRTNVSERAYEFAGQRLLVVEQHFMSRHKETSEEYNVWLVPGYMQKSTLDENGNWHSEVKLIPEMDRDEIITFLSAKNNAPTNPENIQIWE